MKQDRSTVQLIEGAYEMRGLHVLNRTGWRVQLIRGARVIRGLHI